MGFRVAVNQAVKDKYPFQQGMLDEEKTCLNVVFIPADLNVCPIVKLRHKWLDIKKWCAIYDVNIADFQDVLLNAIQSDYGQPDRVWPSGMPYREDAPFLVIQEGRCY